MAHQSPIGNPFMLMMHPEVVLAAIARSEHLEQLNRRLCRPLDKPGLGGASAEDGGSADEPEAGADGPRS